MPMTPLVNIPTTASPSTFDARADNFLGVQLPVFVTQANALETNVNAREISATASASQALADRILTVAAAAIVTATNPATNASNAANSAAAAAVSAGIAQAVSPDSPVRFNARHITSNLTIGSAYNAVSGGPITIAAGITVTVQDNATWSIV